jgi:hypothetical protein
METKTHYRKVFKSDHLGVADLEDFIEQGNSRLIFTISHVNQEMGAKVAGRKINANIAYFKESIKPLVLNATNSKVMRDLSGSCFVENWKNITVQLYIDRDARLKGEVVGGVRVSPKKVSKSKPVITKDSPKMWENAKKAFLRDGNFDSVLEKADLSKENQDSIIAEVNNGVL